MKFGLPFHVWPVRYGAMPSLPGLDTMEDERYSCIVYSMVPDDR